MFARAQPLVKPISAPLSRRTTRPWTHCSSRSAHCTMWTVLQMMVLSLTTFHNKADVHDYLGSCEGQAYKDQCLYEYDEYYAKEHGQWRSINRRDTADKTLNKYDCRMLRGLAQCLRAVTHALNQNHHMECLDRRLDADRIVHGFLHRDQHQIEDLCRNYTAADSACEGALCPLEQQLMTCRLQLHRDHAHAPHPGPYTRTLATRERPLQTVTPRHSGLLKHMDLLLDLTAHAHTYSHVDVVVALYDGYPTAGKRPLGRLVRRRVNLQQWEVRVRAKKHKQMKLTAGHTYYFSINAHGYLKKNRTRVRIRDDIRVPKCTDGLYWSPYPRGQLGCKERMMNFRYDTYFRLWQTRDHKAEMPSSAATSAAVVLAEQLVINSWATVGNAREHNHNCSSFHQTFQVAHPSHLQGADLVFGVRLPFLTRHSRIYTNASALYRGHVALLKGGPQGAQLARVNFTVDCANSVWRNFTFQPAVRLQPCTTYTLRVRGRSPVGAWYEVAYNILSWKEGGETPYKYGHLHNPYFAQNYPKLARQTDMVFKLWGTEDTESQPEQCLEEFALVSKAAMPSHHVMLVVLVLTLTKMLSSG